MRHSKHLKRRTKLIVGCGNPGEEYSYTRHNVGFQCIDFLSKHFNTPLNIEKKKSIYGRKVLDDDNEIVLLKPQTFMLHTGEAVLYLASFLKIDIQDIFVIFDDIQLPFPRVEIIHSSDKVVHNAVKSLNEDLFSDVFVKCAIGIGPLPEGVKEEDYYLGNFLESAQKQLPFIFEEVLLKLQEFLKLPSAIPSS